MRSTFALGFLALVATSGCTDDGVPDLETTPVLAVLDELIDEHAERAIADAGPNDDADVVLAHCPIEGVETLLDATFELIDTPGLDAALNQANSGVLTVRSDLDQPIIECHQGEYPAEIGFYVTTAPADLAAYAARRVAQEPELDESRLFRGGRFHQICAAQDDPLVQDVCEVIWIDVNVLIGVFLRQPSADDVSVNDIEERFQYVLPTIVDRFSDN